MIQYQLISMRFKNKALDVFAAQHYFTILFPQLHCLTNSLHPVMQFKLREGPLVIVPTNVKWLKRSVFNLWPFS